MTVKLRQNLSVSIYAEGADDREAREKLREIRQKILDIKELHSLDWSSKIVEVKEPSGSNATKEKGT